MSENKPTTENLDAVADMKDNDFEDLMSEEESQDNAQSPAESMSLLHDLPVTLAMEVDSIQIPIGKLLSLSEGEVLPLNKKANEPMDITVNGKLIAKAEVVVVDNRYGLRLVEVINKVSPGTADKK